MNRKEGEQIINHGLFQRLFVLYRPCTKANELWRLIVQLQRDIDDSRSPSLTVEKEAFKQRQRLKIAELKETAVFFSELLDYINELLTDHYADENINKFTALLLTLKNSCEQLLGRLNTVTISNIGNSSHHDIPTSLSIIALQFENLEYEL